MCQYALLKTRNVYFNIQFIEMLKNLTKANNKEIQ